MLTDRQTDKHGQKHVPPPLSEVMTRGFSATCRVNGGHKTDRQTDGWRGVTHNAALAVGRIITKNQIASKTDLFIGVVGLTPAHITNSSCYSVATATVLCFLELYSLRPQVAFPHQYRPAYLDTCVLSFRP